MEAYRFNVICNKQFEMETDQTDRQAKTQKNIYTCKNTQKKNGQKRFCKLKPDFCQVAHMLLFSTGTDMSQHIYLLTLGCSKISL